MSCITASLFGQNKDNQKNAPILGAFFAGLFCFQRNTDFGNPVIWILIHSRGNMVNVKHWTLHLEVVFLHPLRNFFIDLTDLLIASIEDGGSLSLIHI